MSIATTIQSIKDNLENAYDELLDKGATIPANKNIENLADAIASIQSGGGGTYELTEKDISDSMLYYDLEIFGGVTMPTQAEYSSQYASYYKLAQKHMQGGSQ